MKRSLYLLILITAVMHFSGTAQDYKVFSMGVRVAPALDWMKMDTPGYENDGLRAGFAAGVVADIFFTRNYGISTGFSFNWLSGKQHLTDTLIYQGNSYTDSYAKYNFTYFEIPVMLKMRTNPMGIFSLYAQVGVGTGFRLKTITKNELVESNGESTTLEPTTYSAYTTLMREAVLAGIGTEITIDKSSRAFVGLNYSNTLNDMFKGMNIFINEKENGTINYVELSIGFLF